MAKPIERGISHSPRRPFLEVVSSSTNPLLPETAVVVDFLPKRPLVRELRRKIGDYIDQGGNPFLITFRKPAELGSDWKDWFANSNIASGYVNVSGIHTQLFVYDGENHAHIDLRGEEFVEQSPVSDVNRLRFGNALMDNVVSPAEIPS